MKKILLFVLTALLPIVAAAATPSFDSSKKYRIVCKSIGSGALVLGSNHDSQAYLYYAENGDDATDAWWYIKADGNGYTIQNAQSSEYITYYATRIDGVAKGLALTSSVTSDEARWTITQYNGEYCVIANVQNTSQWFNLRTDGTNLLGTYTGNTGSDNEQFCFYDENGNLVGDGGSTDTGEVDTEGFTGTKGYTSDGEYWERQGISSPVVYTTDTSNPVLYSIVNVRSGQYAYVSDDQLMQTDNSDSRTKFYFVKQDDGNAQIFTENGAYVSTSYERTSNSPVSVVEGTPSGNLWAIEWASTTSNNGYGICKKDNLNTDTGTGGGWGGGGGWPGGGWTYDDTYTYWNDYSYSTRFIGLYSLDAGSTFVFLSSDKRHIDNLASAGITFPSKPDTGETAVALYSVTDTLRLAEKDVVYDKTSKAYFFPLPSSLLEGGDYTAKVKADFHEGYNDYTLYIDDYATDSETGEITVKDVTCSRSYTLALKDAEGTVKAQATLNFTFLPLVELNVSSCNGSYYTTGTIRVTDADIEGYDSIVIAAYKYRGATAQGYAKKAYAIKLRDEAGSSVDRSFFGLREDNNWILDAMAVDPSCMRNRLSTDLWNDFSTAPYYKSEEKKALTGTRGHFVEVFLNGKYHGLYCMTEKMDRKQLKLKKYKSAADSKTGEEEIRGLLYKSSQWSYEVFMGHEQDSRNFSGRAPQSYTNILGYETWASYEQKYPDYEDETVQWAPLYNAVNFVATSSQSEFDEKVADYFDRPVLDDYYLFIELLLATDNHGKNMFYYVYDRTSDFGDKLSLAPWDLDGVWGGRWDGSTRYTSDYTQDFDNFLWSYEHGELTTYYKLRNSTTLNWSSDLAKRYAELRPNCFNPDSLSKRVADYANLFAKSNADVREQNRWSSLHNGIQSAATYMESWIKGRITALDEKYDYDPTISAVNEAALSTYFAAMGGDNGCIAVNCGKAQNVRVYNLNGSLLRQQQVGQGQTILHGFAAGVYVVNGVKVVVR